MPVAKKTKKATPAPKPEGRSQELTLVDQLAEILNSTGLSEIELEQKGIRVRVSKNVVANVQHVQHMAGNAMAAPTMVAAPAKVEATAEHPGAVKSPMVGTAYLASAPGTPDFVTIGASVKQGQTLLIIEAMKTMNQIPSPRSGKVTAILIENGQPVEFGEAMLVIE